MPSFHDGGRVKIPPSTSFFCIRFVGGEDRRQPKDAIRAGVKRSVKDRLGSRREQKEFQHKGQDSFDPEMSIPPPGMTI